MTDALLYKELTKTNRVFRFLIGLNSDLDGVKGRILGIKPLLILKTIFYKVGREESRSKLMVGPSVLSSDGSTLLTKRLIHTSEGSSLAKRTTLNKPFCNYCKKSDYTIKECWELHIKPATVQEPRTNSKWKTPKPPTRSYANKTVSNSSITTNLPTKDLIQTLLVLLNQMQTEVQEPIQESMASTGDSGMTKVSHG